MCTATANLLPAEVATRERIEQLTVRISTRGKPFEYLLP